MARTTPVALLLAGSGFAALVYQTAWLRGFRLIFGGTTPAMGAVLAIFLGGLGLGGWWLGARAERSPRPLRLYGLLELGVSLCAAATPFLLGVVERVYVAAGGVTGLGEAGATAVRLGLAALVIGIPVTLMGGTLPAAARAVTTGADAGRRSLAALYGANTLGAVAGTLLPTFVLFERLGVARTLWAACALNLAVAAIAIARGWRQAARAEAPTDDSDPGPAAEQGAAAAGAAEAAEAAAGGEACRRRGAGVLPAPFVLAAAFAAGFGFLLAEIVWYRLAAPILGGTTYSFGLVLAFALLGIGLGGLLYGRGGAATRPSAGLLALTLALEAALLLVPYALGDGVARLAADLREHRGSGFAGIVGGWAAVAALLVLPASLVAGYQFPLLIALKGQAARGVARDTGLVYAANTLGSIAGSLAGGFWLLPRLGALGAWWLAGLVLLGAGAAVAAAAARRERRAVALTAGLTGCVLLLWVTPGPSAVWRHGGIGAGRSGLGGLAGNERRAVEHGLRRHIVLEREGRECALAVLGQDGLAFIVDGKVDGNATRDAITCVLLGMLGASLHEDPQRAFIVGLGSGETAGWLGRVPTMREVVVAEIEPAVLEYARLAAAGSHDVLGQERVHVRIGDARELLATARADFDLIVSEPSNPYRAGVANLFTRELYQAARARLAPGGIFVQWLQAYEIDRASFESVLATFASVFPGASVWQSKPGDLLLVGPERGQLSVDVEALRLRLRAEPYRSAFGAVAGIFDAEGVLALYLGDRQLVRGSPPLNTDDRNLLEYGFARTLGDPSQALFEAALFAESRALGAARPVTRGAVDWPRVERLRSRTAQVIGDGGHGFPVDDEDPWSRFAALVDQGAWGPAAEAAVDLAPPERDLFARALRVEAIARALAPRQAVGAVASLEREIGELAVAGAAGDATWLHLGLGVSMRAPDLPARARRAFAAAREDPWVPAPRIERALDRLVGAALPPEVAGAIARSLLEAPFALSGHEAARRVVAQKLAIQSRDAALAAAAFALDEPFPVWAEEPLTLRREAYAAAGQAALADRALADLERFRAGAAP